MVLNPFSRILMLRSTSSPKSHVGESSCDLKYLPGESHVKTPGMKFTHFFIPSPDASGGQKGGHGKIDGLLKLREILMGPVGSAKGIA